MSMLTDAKELLLASEVEQMRGRQMGKTAEEAGAVRPRPAQPEPVGAGTAETHVETWDGVASQRPASSRSELSVRSGLHLSTSVCADVEGSPGLFSGTLTASGAETPT